MPYCIVFDNEIYCTMCGTISTSDCFVDYYNRNIGYDCDCGTVVVCAYEHPYTEQTGCVKKINCREINPEILKKVKYSKFAFIIPILKITQVIDFKSEEPEEISKFFSDRYGIELANPSVDEIHDNYEKYAMIDDNLDCDDYVIHWVNTNKYNLSDGKNREDGAEYKGFCEECGDHVEGELWDD